MMLATPSIYFLVPGDINNLTGGYAYDRRLLAELHELGVKVQLTMLSSSFPNPDAYALDDAKSTLAGIPDDSVVIVDGLAFGVMAELAQQHAQRLKLIELCHHPLALETSLTAQQQQSLRRSEQVALAIL